MEDALRRGAGTADWKGYAFCVLEHLHRMLRRREVFAKNSSKWGDPRAKLLDGEAWEQAKPTVLVSLALPAEAGEHLAARAALLDGTYREVAGRVPAHGCNVGHTPVIGAGDALKCGDCPTSTRRICVSRRTGRRTPP